jgi:isopropylmalate/homocitrate/citramalate synthase
MVSEVIDMGVIALSLADSTGMANPNSIKQLLEKPSHFVKTPLWFFICTTLGDLE